MYLPKVKKLLKYVNYIRLTKKKYNDYSNEKDEKDSTECERLLSTIYKKVKYVLHITGTAHSLLYNITTRLKKDNNIQIKISKV